MYIRVYSLSHVCTYVSVPLFAETGPFLVVLQLQFAEVLSAAGQFAPARDCLTGCLQAEEQADQRARELRGRILLAVAINEVRWVLIFSSPLATSRDCNCHTM